MTINFEIAQYIKTVTGIEFLNIEIFKNKVMLFCKHNNIDVASLLDKLKTNEQVRQDFINYLTTNETYFFRELIQIEELVKLASNTKNKIDILCLPCSSGEEPYSIAIQLVEANINNFKICGIDINTKILQKAQQGIYSQRSIGKIPKKLIEKYFIIKDEKYEISDKIKSFVTFKQFNIFNPDIYSIGKFDYIFSRNMLIYFDNKTKQKAKTILQKLRKNQNQEIFFGHADLY